MDHEFTEEQKMLQATIRDFVRREISREYIRKIDEEKKFPNELWAKMAKAGILGTSIPEEYEGSGGGMIDEAIVIEELARGATSVSYAYFITTFAGTHSVGNYGSEAQKKFFLPRIVSGQIKVAISLTEPGGGTDVLGALSTFAEERDDCFVINGQKMFITLAHESDYLLTVARTKKDVPKRSHGISVFVVDRHSPGIEVQKVPTVGMGGTGTNAVFYTNVEVPKENLLGEKDQGWRNLTTTLNNERVGTAALCVGTAQAALEDSIAYAKERHAFGKPIGQFQAIQHYIADMAVKVELARLLTYKAAWLYENNKPCAVEASMAKLVAANHACQVADTGIQIMGGYGYTMEYDMQRYWRDVRLNRLGPISDEMTRNIIAESFGLPRSF